jgi:drug/metabolite transporter (DMT)-like permease
MTSPDVDRAAVRVPGLRYALAAACFSALWASSFVAIKMALRDCPPLLLMSSRFLLAAVVLFTSAWVVGVRWPDGWLEWRRIGLLGVLSNALYLGVNALTLQYLDAGVSAVLASTNLLLLALVAPWALGEGLTWTKVVGLVAGGAGVGWVMWSRVEADNHPAAMAVFLAAVVFIVTATVLFKRWTFVANLVVVTGGQCLFGGLLLLVPALTLESVWDVRVTRDLLIAQAYMVVMVSGVTTLIWLWLLSRGRATRASAYFFLNPVFGLLLGAAVLQERLSTGDLAGAAAVALGIYLVERSR